MKLDSKIAAKFNKVLEKEGILALAKKMVKKFRGAEMYLVGGAVRDVILGRPIKDVDVLVRKVKIGDLEKFLAKCGKVNLVGKRFGVFKFVPKNPPHPSFYKGGSPSLCKRPPARNLRLGEEAGRDFIDIAIPRTDFSFGTGVYKDFKVKSNPNLPIEDDLARRDFTVNAMAWDIYNGRLVDPYGGLADLKKKIIRAVGKPAERFAEDYSRLLRAIRFSMQLGFKIESKTWAAVKKYIGHINDTTPPTPPLTKGGKGESAPLTKGGKKGESAPLTKGGKGESTPLTKGGKGEGVERKVAYEIIAEEFLKSFDAEPVLTIKKYLECGALKKLMPEIVKMKECEQPREFHSEGDVLTHTLLALENLNSKMFRQYFPAPVGLTAKVAILLHDIGKPAAKKQVDGRTVFYNHDKLGAEIARKFLERLKMSAPPDVGANIDEVVRLVGNHLLFFYSPPAVMKKTTIEKYLFHKQFSGEAHMQLFLADAMATKPAKGGTDFARFKEAYKIWQSLKGRRKTVPPEPVLDGNEVMKILGLKPGPKVGEVLQLLREEQLNKKVKTKQEAERYIKKLEIRN